MNTLLIDVILMMLMVKQCGKGLHMVISSQVNGTVTIHLTRNGGVGTIRRNVLNNSDGKGTRNTLMNEEAKEIYLDWMCSVVGE